MRQLLRDVVSFRQSQHHLGGLHHVLAEHARRDGADTARHGRDGIDDIDDLIERDIAHKRAVIGDVDADVDERLARRDVIRTDHGGVTHTGHDDIGLARKLLEIGRARVGYGHGRVALEQQHGERLAR